MIYGKSQAVLVSSGPGSYFPAAIRPDLGRTGPEEIISQELVILLLSLSVISLLRKSDDTQSQRGIGSVLKVETLKT